MPRQKNQSGNPKGRKKMTEEEKQKKEKFTQMLKASVPEALKILLEIMCNVNALNRDRISCARVILERAYGSTPLLLNAEKEDDFVEIRIIRERNESDEGYGSDAEWNEAINEME